MIKNDFVWKIGGEAGFGIMSSGAIFGKACMRHGLSVCDYVEYPSLIRGGHNTYIVRANQHEIYSPITRVDLLVALNKETITLHEHELSIGGAVIFDGESIKEPGFTRTDIKQMSVPLMKLAKGNGGEPVMINTVSLGASLALLGAEFEFLNDLLSEIFGKKGQDVVNLNVKIAKAGYDYIKANVEEVFERQMAKQEAPKRMLISGTEAVGMGAIKAGCKFFAAYPMTPISDLLAYISMHDEDFSYIYKQPEDEIAGINMIIGASFAGVRAMTATSGGGFSLMAESVGLAAQTETPIVIVMGMRPGPATGLPTWTGQADLRFVLHAGQDEFPKVILAPGDVNEAFQLTHDAFNFADKYQLPVIVLADKELLESHWSVDLFKTDDLKIDRGKLMSDQAAIDSGEGYARYRLTADGISPRKIPGQQGRPFLAGSDEHEENSLFNEEADNRVNMMNKRMKKLELATADVPEPALIGPTDAPLTLVGFGSTKTAIVEAFKTINQNSPVANYLHYSYIWPLKTKVLEDLAAKEQKFLGIEGNYTGQFAGFLLEHTGIRMPVVISKFDGRQFFPEEIVEQVEKYWSFSQKENATTYMRIGGKSVGNISHASSRDLMKE